MKGFSSWRQDGDCMIADGKGEWVRRCAVEMIEADRRKYKAEAEVLTEERDLADRAAEEMQQVVAFNSGRYREAARDLEGMKKQRDHEIALKRKVKFNADRWRAARHAGLVGKIRKLCGR